MRNIFERFVEVLKNTGYGLIIGLIGGLIITMSLIAIHHKPLWCLGTTVFFMLFHLGDFKRFYREKNWMAVSGRIVVIFAIASFITSFIVLAIIDFDPSNLVDHIIILGSILFSIIAATFLVFLEYYGRHTRLYKDFWKTIEGFKVIGVFWKK